MFNEYYPKEYRSTDADGASGDLTAYDEKVTVDGEEVEVHVVPQGEGKKPLVYPKQDYEKWGDPIYAEKLNKELIRNSKKAQEVLKHNNETISKLQALESKVSELERERLKSEATIEALQKFGNPKTEDKPPKSEKKEFNVVEEAYKIAGVSNEEDWDDLSPSKRFAAQTEATQRLMKHNQLQTMEQLSKNTAETNQRFMQEQKLTAMIVQAGLVPDKVKTEMESHGVIFNEAGINFYINSLKGSLGKPKQPDTIDEINKRNQLINKIKPEHMTGAEQGFEIVSKTKRREKEYVDAVTQSNIDHNTQASQILRKFRK